MLLTLALVIFTSAILVTFSRELGNFIKKIFTFPGAKLMIPLTGMTALLIYYQTVIIWILLYIRIALLGSSELIGRLLPFQTGAAKIGSAVILFVLTLFPVLAIFAWKKYREQLPFAYPWIVSTVIWLFLVILFSSWCLIQMNFCM